MKVVLVSHNFPPVIGGVGTMVAVLAGAFVEAGHDVTVVTTDPGPTDGYGYAVVRKPGPLQLFRIYHAADILVLSNLSIKLFYPLLFMRRPFALTHHSESAFRLSRSLFSLDLLRRNIRDRATHLMASGYLGRQSGFPRYVVTHPFADIGSIGPGAVLPMSARRHAVFVGRLVPEKGIMFLAERWQHIRKILGVEKLRVIGGGSLAGELQRRIESGEFSDVEFLGKRTRAEAAWEMGHSIYSLVPSLWDEPFGTVALESLAAGAIVIHSDRGGMGEGTGKLAFIFNPDDPASLDDALAGAAALHKRLMESDEEAAHYSAEIASHVPQFAPQKVVEKILVAMTGQAG